MVMSAGRALTGRRRTDHDLPALAAVVGRNPVSPPELTGNAPVSDIIRPVKIGLFHTGRNPGYLSSYRGAAGKN